MPNNILANFFELKYTVFRQNLYDQFFVVNVTLFASSFFLVRRDFPQICLFSKLFTIFVKYNIKHIFLAVCSAFKKNHFFRNDINGNGLSDGNFSGSIELKE